MARHYTRESQVTATLNVLSVFFAPCRLSLSLGVSSGEHSPYSLALKCREYKAKKIAVVNWVFCQVSE